MQFNQKFARMILGTSAVSLALFFAVGVSSLFAQPPANSVHAYAPGTAPQTHDACQPMYAALEKSITTPYHMYMTETSAAVQSGKPQSSEIISVGGTRYILVNAKWNARPVSADQSKADVAQVRENAKTGTCKYVRDEAVNGENASLIATHNKSEFATSDSQIWISKSKGLILKQETDLDVGGGAGKSHSSLRYEYTNVQAPKM
jgi:hypothetical protein